MSFISMRNLTWVFLMLVALGLSAPLFGMRLMPVGTVYDPFIARGLDTLNYDCYQDGSGLVIVVDYDRKRAHPCAVRQFGDIAMLCPDIMKPDPYRDVAGGLKAQCVPRTGVDWRGMFRRNDDGENAITSNRAARWRTPSKSKNIAARDVLQPVATGMPFAT